MTRTVRDNALLLQVLAGHDPEDPGSADVAVPDYSADLERGVKGLKIGLVRHFYAEDMQAHPEQAQAIESAAEVLRGLGAEVREVRLAPLQDYAAARASSSAARPSPSTAAGWRSGPATMAISPASASSTARR